MKRTVNKFHKYFTNNDAYFISLIVLTTVLFIFGPSHIFITNKREFPKVFLEYLPGLVLASVVVFLLLFLGYILVIFCLNKFGIKTTKITNIILKTQFSLGLLIWIQFNFLNWDYGVFDGTVIDFSQHHRKALFEALIWVGIPFLIFKVSKINKKFVKKVSIFIILIQTFYFIYNFVSFNQQLTYKRYELSDQSKYSFSANKNVIYLVLDALQSDIFLELIKENNEVSFDGFTYFSNTLAGYNSTYPTVALMLSGQFYKNEQPIHQYLNNIFLNKNTILTDFINSDYNVEVYPINRMTLPVNDKIADNANKRDYSLASLKDLIYILDITLFRSFPQIMKRHIYSNQSWFLTSRLSKLLPEINNSQAGGQLGSHRMNLEFANNIQNITLNDNYGEFKFYHLFGAHNPYRLTKNLQLSDDIDQDIDGYKEQVKAMITLINRLIDSLKENKIYDNSLIVIAADHGLGYIPKWVEHDWKTYHIIGRHTWARALPALMIKPFNSTGPLIIDDNPASLKDVPKTITYLADISSKNYPGINIFGNDNNYLNRERKYYYFNWQHRNWNTSYLPPMNEYIIQGDARKVSSWRTDFKLYLENGETGSFFPPTYQIGKEIKFGRSGNSEEYQLGGWSHPDENSTWTEYLISSLLIPLPDIPGTDLLLEINFSPFKSKEVNSQKVNFYINNKKFGEIRAENKETHKLIIPNELIDSELIYLSFELPEANLSPKELGLSPDPRKLGISVEYLKLIEKSN